MGELNIKKKFQFKQCYDQKRGVSMVKKLPPCIAVQLEKFEI